MRIIFITIGKPRASWAIDALAHYTKFVSKYADVSFRYVKSASASLTSPAEILRLEADRLVDLIDSQSGFQIVCDKQGKTFDSEAFAHRLLKGTDTHGGRAMIIVGGAWGLEAGVLKRANLVWSFGPMTLPHELALITACEQTARALSILRGDKYHK